MAGLFHTLEIAGRALAVTQSGIHVTSHNVANVETPGYSRQRQILAAGNPIESGSGAIGTGVEQLGIERIADTLLLRQLATEDARAASLGVQGDALARIEEIWNEQARPGLGARVAGLFDAFEDLAASATPGAPVEREAVRAAAELLVDTIREGDAELRSLQGEADRAARVMLGTINELAQRIADLNGEIVRAEAFGPANDLRDRRDVLLRELARKVEITSFEQPDGGVVVLVGRGLALVDGTHARSLVAADDPTHPFDPSFASIQFDTGSGWIDVTDAIGNGELGGWLVVRDELTANAIRELDAFAYNVAARVNEVHAAGVGLDGSSGDFFAMPAGVEDTARNFALAPAVEASADAIAAGLGTDPGDNRNALALAALRNQAAPVFLPGDAPGAPSGPSRTLLDHVAATVGRIGTEVSALATERASQDRVLQQLENRRDSLSGVSIDEEMVQLLRLEAAYQANARVIQSLDQLLDTVVSMLR